MLIIEHERIVCVLTRETTLCAMVVLSYSYFGGNFIRLLTVVFNMTNKGGFSCSFWSMEKSC
jgi:hypothetical protein